MYILAALLVGFVAGVLFRDAYSMIRKALKEYHEEMGARPGKNRRPAVWIIIIFFSLFQIALGAGVVVVTMESQAQQDCLVNVAESSTSTRNSAIAWVNNFKEQVQAPQGTPQEQQVQQFVTKSENYVNELKGDNKQVEECVNDKGGLW